MGDSSTIAEQCRQLVAEYLSSSGYTQTLVAFQAEAPPSSSSGAGPALPLDLKKLVQLWLDQQAISDKLAEADLNVHVQKAQAFDWHKSITPILPHRVTRTLRDIHLSAILSVAYCQLPRRTFDTATASYRSERIPCIVTSSTDKRICFTNTRDWTLEDSFEPCSSVTLSIKMNPVYPWLMLSGAMDGSYSITNLLTREVSNNKVHSKYVIRIAWSDNGLWFCSLGYDRKICLYEVIVTPPAERSLDADEFANQPTFAYKLRWEKMLPSNPEAAVFLPESSYLVFSRRDDNQLHYINLAGDAEFEMSSYNLNENLDSHISFCILSIAIHPCGRAITLQTDTPISRIMILPFHSAKRLRETLYTNAEQSIFSNPRHAWLADGSGVAVSSDDGILRIVDLNGKTKCSIPSHGVAAAAQDEEVGSESLRARYAADRGSSVIRDLCVLPDNTVVSCGLDKTIRISQP